jgi:hypothetical protein
MKITVLLDYPDDAAPEFTADMMLHGGKVETVQFDDLFREHETLAEEALALVDLGPSHPLFEFRLNRLRALVDFDDVEEDEEVQP